LSQSHEREKSLFSDERSQLLTIRFLEDHSSFTSELCITSTRHCGMNVTHCQVLGFDRLNPSVKGVVNKATTIQEMTWRLANPNILLNA